MTDSPLRLCAECLARHASDDDNSLCGHFAPCPFGMTVEAAREVGVATRRMWHDEWVVAHEQTTTSRGKESECP